MEWIFLHLKNIVIKNFRNYSNLNLEFNKPINLFFGENAAGKTNLLEAIYYLATGSSHRTNNLKELISWERNFFYIKGEIDKDYTDIVLEVGYNFKNQKKFKLNGLEKKERNIEKFGLNVVLFCPEDLMLIKGPPENRRKFINLEISQTDKKYAYHLSQYNKVLKQRNKFLKEISPSYNYDYIKEQLSIWDKQLAEHGIEIIKKRRDIIHKLGILSKLNSRKISEGKEFLELKYDCSLNLTENTNKEYLKKLSCKKQLEKDIYRRFTGIGPHRDDILFYINDKEAKQFGSQGQIRTIVLSLKIAELELIKSEIGEYPILLLDDVLSELDINRRRHLLNFSKGKVQTFITGTKKDDFVSEILNKAQVFKVIEGEVVSEN